MVRPMLEWGLKIATILTKVGAHLACKMGGMIPNFSDNANFAALILETPSVLDYQISMTILESFLDDGERGPKITIEDRLEAEDWLKDFLNSKCKEKRDFYYEKFKLKKVRYKGDSGLIAWICDVSIQLQGDLID